MDEAVLSLRTKQRGANGNSPTALPPLRSPSRRVGALSPEQLLAAELGKNRGALGQADAQQQEDSPIAQIELAAERAMRGAKGLRARREERRLKGIRFASQDPKKAFANLGRLGGHSPKRSRRPAGGSPTQAAALEASPTGDEPSSPTNTGELRKGDEVAVTGEPGAKGIVQGVWNSHRTSAVVDGEVVSARKRREIFVRFFPAGGGWFDEAQLTLLRHPTKQELRDTVFSTDPDLGSSLGRSLAHEFRDALQPDRGGRSPDRMLISELTAFDSRCGRAVTRNADRAAGESVLTEETKALFRAVMTEDISKLARALNQGTSNFLTVKNGEGKSLHAVARTRGKHKVRRWLESLGITQ